MNSTGSGVADTTRQPAFGRHLVITGVGRSGSSFLIQLLTRLGLETGIDSGLDVSPPARAGFELRLRDPDAPYVVKCPMLRDFADEVLSRGDLEIDHALIPVRRFDAAAASRAHVQAETTGAADGRDVVAGGLWDTDNSTEQAAILRLKFTRLIEALVRYDVPMTFLSYPRLVRDPDYTYRKLRFLLPDVTHDAFAEAFGELVKPAWVHQFTDDDK